MMSRNDAEQLFRNLEPFSTVPSEALRSLAAGATERVFVAKQIIFHEQTDGDTGYVILEGRVALLKTSPGGKELIVELLGPGELFGVLVLLDAHPYPLTARAQTRVTALALKRSQVQKLIRDTPSVHAGFTDLLRRRLSSAHGLSRALAHDKVDARVASILIAVSAKSRESERIELGRQELADLCGITIETASRVIKVFEKRGAVDVSEIGAVKLLDRAFLEHVAGSQSV
ncbi:MAG: Crp/Fnr family transcriptional regulator [Bdellovibrionota bacterium]